MAATPSVTLFSGQIDTGRASASLAVSAAIHVVVGALITFGIFTAPRIDMHAAQARLIVRDLDLHTPEEQAQRAVGVIPYPGTKPAATPSRRTPHAVLRVTVHARKGPQTLLQPDLAKRLALAEEVPVPRVLIWTPTKVAAKHLVAPAPKPPATAAPHPSLDRPNQEIQPADVDLASSSLPSVKLQLMPSTTSPVKQQNTAALKSPPASVSQAQITPTPAAVLSVSDLTMKNGAAVLPPVNETASINVPGTLAPGAPAGSGKSGAGSSNSGSGTGGQDVKLPAPTVPQGVRDNAATGAPQGARTGAVQGDPMATHITLPQNGQFGAVLIGDSIEDEFPETGNSWGGRMAYTVYLHVGLARSWILQYALPTEADATAAGEATRIQAPWPYSIVRPNLAPDSVDADAILVHGYVGQDGHFQGLSVVFPQAFPQAQFVLKSLDQWQFRPAAENGQTARVEVLLIIPEELD